MVTHDINDALIMGDHIVIISGNPSEIVLEKTIDIDHPRNLEKNPVLADLRDELFLMMGVSNAV
jgi:ABC-type nitrate/sulfonate/bicarbonate transport system ATPase subunit